MSAPLRKLVMVDTATRELWSVSESGDVNEVAAILSRGVNVNARNEHGMTALMRAARNGHAAVVRTLLEHGADPNIARNDKFTALALAAFFGHTETVRILIDHGAKTEVVTRSGTSPRLWATARTFTETARCFEKPAAPLRSVAAPVSPAPVPVSPEPAPVSAAPVIKTLKDPPEIWDLVHEVPRNFNARSAFLTRIKSVKWPVAVGAFAVLLFVVAGGVGVFISRSSKASNVSVKPPPVQTPVQTAVEVPVSPAPLAPAPVESPVTEAAPVVVTKKAPATVTRQSKPRAVAEENVIAVAPKREEPPAVAPQVEKPKPRESPVKSAPNSALSPHLIAPAKNAKVIQWP
jgi:Ankyrin repeats (3 copies)